MKNFSTNIALSKAKFLVSRGQLDQARILYNSILKSFPKNHRAIKGLLALDQCKIADNPKSIEYEINDLVALYKNGKIGIVVERAEKLSHKFPESSTLLKVLGLAFKDLGKLEESEQTFKKLIAINSLDPNDHNNLGIILKYQGKMSEAIKSFKQAIKLDSNYAGAFNNLGCTYQDQGMLQDAVKSFRKVISLSANYAEGYYNLGNVLQEMANLNEAINFYKKAIELRPNYAEAYFNIGVALQAEDKFVESLKAYKKVIELQPDNVSAYFNSGVILYEQGKFEKSIAYYGKVLILDPNFRNWFSNIFLSLQCIKVQDTKLYHRLVKDLGKTSTIEAKKNLSLLTYLLARGTNHIDKSFCTSVRQISTDRNLVLNNPNTIYKKDLDIDTRHNRIVALKQTGRAGTGLLHSLIDGHSKISVLPSIYFSEYFDFSTWTNISSGGWAGLVDRFIDHYPILFDASDTTPVLSISGTYLTELGKKEGLCNVGHNKNEILTVDKNSFREELIRLIANYPSIDALSFFKLIHIAYEKVVYDCSSKKILFYHIHNPDIYSQLNFMRLAPEANWIMMVREPIQSCESWIRKKYLEGDYHAVAMRIVMLLYDIDNIIFRKHPSIGLRLEDLKRNPQETLTSLCDWMGVEEESSLYEMTAQGKKWWGEGDSLRSEFTGGVTNPFGLESVNRKVGTIFTEYDQYILKTLFYPFRVAFDYTKENEAKFLTDLKKVRPLLDQMFEFEIEIMKSKGMSPNEFMASGPFKFLRSGLIERWNILNELGTYPCMIKPLTIRG